MFLYCFWLHCTEEKCRRENETQKNHNVDILKIITTIKTKLQKEKRKKTNNIEISGENSKSVRAPYVLCSLITFMVFLCLFILHFHISLNT